MLIHLLEIVDHVQELIKLLLTINISEKYFHK